MAVASPAADEMDDFELVSLGKLGCRPSIAWNEFAIEFNRHTVRLHAKQVQERGDSGDRAELAILAVDGELHSAAVARQAGGRSMGMSKLIQPFSLFNSFGHVQASGFAYRFQCLLDILSGGDEQSSRDQRGAANPLSAVNGDVLAMLEFGTQLCD